MKSATFWEIITQILPHRRNITSLLQSPAGYSYVRYEVFTAVTMKGAVFCDVAPCDSLRTDISEQIIASIIRVKTIGKLKTTLAVTSNPRTLTRATWHNIPEDGIIQAGYILHHGRRSRMEQTPLLLVVICDHTGRSRRTSERSFSPHSLFIN
jgi:hypothetical protein